MSDFRTSSHILRSPQNSRSSHGAEKHHRGKYRGPWAANRSHWEWWQGARNLQKYRSLSTPDTTTVKSRNRPITPYKQEVAGSSPALPTTIPDVCNAQRIAGGARQSFKRVQHLTHAATSVTIEI